MLAPLVQRAQLALPAFREMTELRVQQVRPARLVLLVEQPDPLVQWGLLAQAQLVPLVRKVQLEQQV